MNQVYIQSSKSLKLNNKYMHSIFKCTFRDKSLRREKRERYVFEGLFSRYKCRIMINKHPFASTVGETAWQLK